MSAAKKGHVKTGSSESKSVRAASLIGPKEWGATASGQSQPWSLPKMHIPRQRVSWRATMGRRGQKDGRIICCHCKEKRVFPLFFTSLSSLHLDLLPQVCSHLSKKNNCRYKTCLTSSGTCSSASPPAYLHLHRQPASQLPSNSNYTQPHSLITRLQAVRGAQRVHCILPRPMTAASTPYSNMSAARDLSRIRTPRSRGPSSSPELEEELYSEYFDWQKYYQVDDQLPGIIHDIPSIIESLHIDSSTRHFDMSGAYPSPYTSASHGSPRDSPPELDHAESTSPSENSFYERHEEPYRPSVASLKQAQAGDDQWTVDAQKRVVSFQYPQEIQVSSNTASEGYATASYGRLEKETPTNKRQRHLVDPEETAYVRKSGACVPCRVKKLKVRATYHLTSLTVRQIGTVLLRW